MPISFLSQNRNVWLLLFRCIMNACQKSCLYKAGWIGFKSPSAHSWDSGGHIRNLACCEKPLPWSMHFHAHSHWVSQQCKSLTVFLSRSLLQATLKDDVTLLSLDQTQSIKAESLPSPGSLFCHATHCACMHHIGPAAWCFPVALVRYEEQGKGKRSSE